MDNTNFFEESFTLDASELSNNSYENLIDKCNLLLGKMSFALNHDLQDDDRNKIMEMQNSLNWLIVMAENEYNDFINSNLRYKNEIDALSQLKDFDEEFYKNNSAGRDFAKNIERKLNYNEDTRKTKENYLSNQSEFNMNKITTLSAMEHEYMQRFADFNEINHVKTFLETVEDEIVIIDLYQEILGNSYKDLVELKNELVNMRDTIIRSIKTNIGNSDARSRELNSARLRNIKEESARKYNARMIKFLKNTNKSISEINQRFDSKKYELKDLNNLIDLRDNYVELKTLIEKTKRNNKEVFKKDVIISPNDLHEANYNHKKSLLDDINNCINKINAFKYDGEKYIDFYSLLDKYIPRKENKRSNYFKKMRKSISNLLSNNNVKESYHIENVTDNKKMNNFEKLSDEQLLFLKKMYEEDSAEIKQKNEIRKAKEAIEKDKNQYKNIEKSKERCEILHGKIKMELLNPNISAQHRTFLIHMLSKVENSFNDLNNNKNDFVKDYNKPILLYDHEKDNVSSNEEEYARCAANITFVDEINNVNRIINMLAHEISIPDNIYKPTVSGLKSLGDNLNLEYYKDIFIEASNKPFDDFMDVNNKNFNNLISKLRDTDEFVRNSYSKDLDNIKTNFKNDFERYISNVSEQINSKNFNKKNDIEQTRLANTWAAYNYFFERNENICDLLNKPVFTAELEFGAAKAVLLHNSEKRLTNEINPHSMKIFAYNNDYSPAKVELNRTINNYLNNNHLNRRAQINTLPKTSQING